MCLGKAQAERLCGSNSTPEPGEDRACRRQRKTNTFLLHPYLPLDLCADPREPWENARLGEQVPKNKHVCLTP